MGTLLPQYIFQAGHLAGGLGQHHVQTPASHVRQYDRNPGDAPRILGHLTFIASWDRWPILAACMGLPPRILHLDNSPCTLCTVKRQRCTIVKHMGACELR